MLPRAWLTLLLPALVATAISVQAQANTADFDGNWSVLIVTDQGGCDRAYRYAVRIDDGRILFRGTEDIRLSGAVSPSGQVRVRVSRGDQSALGTGRLSEDSGTGTWTGHSSQQQCSGHWEAERRE